MPSTPTWRKYWPAVSSRTTRTGQLSNVSSAIALVPRKAGQLDQVEVDHGRRGCLSVGDRDQDVTLVVRVEARNEPLPPLHRLVGEPRGRVEVESARRQPDPLPAPRRPDQRDG